MSLLYKNKPSKNLIIINVHISHMYVYYSPTTIPRTICILLDIVLLFRILCP